MSSICPARFWPTRKRVSAVLLHTTCLDDLIQETVVYILVWLDSSISSESTSIRDCSVKVSFKRGIVELKASAQRSQRHVNTGANEQQQFAKLSTANMLPSCQMMTATITFVLAGSRRGRSRCNVKMHSEVAT